MEDDLITTKEVGNYRIKVYYCHDSECPITNWGLFGSFFFEYSDMHRLHDECNWKTFFYDNKHDLRDVIDAIVMKHIEQKDIVKYLKKGEANGNAHIGIKDMVTICAGRQRKNFYRLLKV